MKLQEHKEIHIALHKSLDELLSDFITQTKKLPSETTVLEFLTWSNNQTRNPTLVNGAKHEND